MFWSLWSLGGERSDLQLPNDCMINSLIHDLCAPVAQRLEQQTHNLLVRGSNPCGGTNGIKQLWAAALLPIFLMCAYSVPVRLNRMLSSLSVAAFCIFGKT